MSYEFLELLYSLSSVDFDEIVVKVDKKSLDLGGEISYIGYTGRYPNFCQGVLWLKIGSTFVGLRNALSNFGGWVVCEEGLPEALKARAKEIQVLANENIPSGCCGACKY